MKVLNSKIAKVNAKLTELYGAGAIQLPTSDGTCFEFVGSEMDTVEALCAEAGMPFDENNDCHIVPVVEVLPTDRELIETVIEKLDEMDEKIDIIDTVVDSLPTS